MKTYKRRDFLQSMGKTALAGAAASVFSRAVSWAAEPAGKIKIGQIGTKHAHASGKIRSMRKFRDLFEVVGVVEPDKSQQSKKKNSKDYRGLKWMTEEQLLNMPGLKAVAVETAVPDLVPTATRVVAAGMHVLIDKPAGVSLPAYKKLLDAATAKKLVVQIGYMFRYNPGFQLCYRAVREGWLGGVFEVHGVISKKFGSSGRRRFSKSPGGTMFELGCHLIDSLVKVLGKPDKVTPYIRRTRPDGLADNQLAVFEYPKAIATIKSAVVEYQGQKRRQFTVCGDTGTVDIRPLEPPKLLLALEKKRDKYKKGYQEVNLPRMTGRYDGEFRDLAKIIRGEKPSDFSPEHDLAAHEAILLASGLPVN